VAVMAAAAPAGEKRCETGEAVLTAGSARSGVVEHFFCRQDYSGQYGSATIINNEIKSVNNF